MTIRRWLKRVPGIRAAAIWLKVLPNPATRRDFLFAYLPPKSIGAEIGVDRGDFSDRILNQVKPNKFHLIDPWKYFESEAYATSRYGSEHGGGQGEMDKRYQQVMKRFQKQIADQQVVIHRALSHELLPDFVDAYFDWVYVDGDHHYDAVKKDLEGYYSKIKPGGWLMGDDYGKQDWKGGVTQAVDEFVALAKVELVEIRNGQFVLKKI